MVGSLTALAAIVVSDIAEAAEPQAELFDEVPAPAPVRLAKVQHAQPQPLEPDLDAALEVPVRNVVPLPRKPRKARVDFGRFEGY